MKKGLIIGILAFVLLTAGLYFSPVTPSTSTEDLSVEEQVEVDLDQKVEEAILIIQSAEGAPMKGITMLKEVLAEKPEHVKANYWLGEFSLISGQFQKAIPRFEVVLKVEPDNMEAANRLASIYVQLNEKEKAKDVLNTFIANNPDHAGIDEIKDMLNNI